MQIVINKDKKELKSHGGYDFPFLISYEKLSNYENNAFLWHWHPEIEITLITKGEMLYRINQAEFQLKENHILFGNSATLHSGCSSNKQDCEYISITFDAKLLYGYDNSLLFTKYVQPILQDFSMSAIHFSMKEDWQKEILMTIKKIISLPKELDTYELDVFMYLLSFWKLLYEHVHPDKAISSQDKKSYERLRNILEYIELNFDTDLSLDAIANHIHLCKSDCCRLFKRYMNVTLFDFILDYRIEKSLSFLLDNTLSIKEVSEKTGFHDANYFAKVFRKHQGCSPTDYRKKKFNGINYPT